MRIRISHATTYAYDMPPTGVTQLLRLTPRDHDGQHVVAWRIDLSEDCLLHQHEDAFGNIIDTDNRNIFWDAQAVFFDRIHRPQGRFVADSNDCRRMFGLV